MKKHKLTPFLVVAAVWLSSVIPLILAAASGPAAPDLMEKLARAAQQYPRANIVFVEKRRDIRFEDDGKYVDRTYCLIKIMTEPAVQYFATLPVSEYYSYRGEAKVDLARVIKQDGTAVELPAEMVADIANPMYRRQNVTDDTMRLKTLTLKNLQVGDAVEYQVEEKCLRPITADFELKEGKYLQEDEPVMYARIEINGPGSKPLNHKLKCAENLAVSFTSEKKAGRTTYLWEAKDVPAFVSEPGWNTRQHFAGRLLASTIPSWSEVSRTGYRINKASMDEDDDLRAAVAEAIRGRQTDEDRAAGIVRFLRKNIGYKGLTSVSAYQGKPATQTFHERFGVCRDVAVLMCSMLRVAGIKGYPAATGYGRVFDSEVPHDIFQHMIVAIPNPSGGYTLYDPTALLATADRLPGYAGGAPLLVYRPEGEDLTRVPHLSATENAGRIDAKTYLSTDGVLSSTVTISGRGVYDEDLRNWCRRSKPEEFRKRWSDLVAQANPASRVVELVTSDPGDLDTPFRVTIKYEAPGYANFGQNSGAIKVPLATDGFERVLTDIVAKARKPERTHPFILTSTVAVAQEELLVLPAGYSVESAPEPTTINAKDVSLQIEYRAVPAVNQTDGDAVTFTKMFTIDSRQFDPAGYLELRKALEVNTNSRSGQVKLIRR